MQVCKPFLVCFCFNTLFPNTTYDEGPCHKRHDTYLKTMFDNDPERGENERVYIKECISTSPTTQTGSKDAFKKSTRRLAKTSARSKTKAITQEKGPGRS